jgi:hypothetical protein
VLPRFVGVGGQRFIGVEVFVALDGESELAADGAQFGGRHVAEFRAAEPEIAQAEGEFVVGVEFGEEPGALSVLREELDDGLEVDHPLIVVDGGALRFAVGEELIELCLSDESHCEAPSWRTRMVRSRATGP